MSERPKPGRGGARPGAGRHATERPATNLRLPAAVAAKLLALTRQRRALGGDRKISQTAVATDLIAAAFAELDAEYQAASDN